MVFDVYVIQIKNKIFQEKDADLILREIIIL